MALSQILPDDNYGGETPASEIDLSHLTAAGKADALLVLRHREGSASAFQTLFERHKSGIFFHIAKILRRNDPATIDDLVQEVFIKAYEHIDRYTFEAGFSSWLYKIATNHAIDFLRKQERRSLIRLTETQYHELEQVTDSVSTDHHILTQERNQALRKAVEDLPPPYRRVIELRFWGDNSYNDMYRKLDLSSGTVKSHVNRAKKWLKKVLSGDPLFVNGD